MTKNMLFLSLIVACSGCRANDKDLPKADQVKITVLSTMLSDYKGIGEWGFAALVEVDGKKLLFDTGAKPETVLSNANELNIDLSEVEDVFLSHNHWDHVGGLLTLRKALMKKNPKALINVHVGKGMFISRSKNGGEGNLMLSIKKEYEALGGNFTVYDKPQTLFENMWITGPVTRIHPEKNWNVSGKLSTSKGLVEDTIPEDMSLAISSSKGWIMVSGCGHSGIINTMEFIQTEIKKEDIYAAIGGFHLFKATDDHLKWTTDKMKIFGLEHFIGAHCTGINSTFIIREMMGMDRKTAVVGAVGNVFELSTGIDSGAISR